MSEDLKKSTLNFFKKAKDTVTEVAEKTIDELERTGTLDEIRNTQTNVKKYMDDKGITEKAEQGLSKAKDISEIAGEHLDQISGKKILEIVEQRLEMQTEYNDLLATKLEEALRRIDVLEKQIGIKK